MIIKTKITLDETVDCCIRTYWLKKDSKKKVLMNIFPILLIWVLYTYLKKDLISFTFMPTIFTICYVGYLYYVYTTGYRKKVKKSLLDSHNGKEIPNEAEFEINDVGILSKTELSEIKIPWSSIDSIEPYKHYIEFRYLGNLLWIEQELSPSINELKSLWKKNETN